jgi:lysozyme family protein
MDIKALQRRIGAADDGVFGRQSKAALLACFTNKHANALTDSDIAYAAARLDATVTSQPWSRRSTGPRQEDDLH